MAGLSLPQTVTLYQPTQHEIDAVLVRAFAKWPALTARIMGARALLVSGGIAGDGAHWQVASQSGKGGYIVTAHQHCTCPDRGETCTGRHFCKHEIATAAYVRVLRHKLQADIQGFDVELAALPNGHFRAFAPQMGYVQLRKNADGVYEFATAASAITYATWLVHVNTTVAVAWPTREGQQVAA